MENDVLTGTDYVIEVAKYACEIEKENKGLSDEEIGKIMRWIGLHSPDVIIVNGKPKIGIIGIQTMLFLTLCEFPEFYIKYELWQRN
jgi:hypothetical protein